VTHRSTTLKCASGSGVQSAPRFPRGNLGFSTACTEVVPKMAPRPLRFAQGGGRGSYQPSLHQPLACVHHDAMQPRSACVPLEAHVCHTCNFPQHHVSLAAPLFGMHMDCMRAVPDLPLHPPQACVHHTSGRPGPLPPPPKWGAHQSGQTAAINGQQTWRGHNYISNH
jgi:hypothetical protein